MELTEGWSNGALGYNPLVSGATLKDGGVWMKSRVWKIDQNRVAVVKPRDD